jgi:hypothetical protein
MFDRRLQAEHDIAAIIETCRSFDVDAVQQECLYGLTWQGAIDGGLAPTSVDAAIAEAERCRAAGIEYASVVVPRGLPGEAQAHGALAAALGALVVDLEYEGVGAGKEYWNASPALIEVYARELRAAAPRVAIGWQPDGRIADNGREGEFELIARAVQPYVDCWLPQLYAGWGVYGRGQATVDADARRFERFAALGPAAPTLYLAESLAEPMALWERVKDRAVGVCAFRFGAMDGAALAAFQGFALPATPPKPPPPEPPAFTLDAVKLGLIRKVLDEQWVELRDNAAALAGEAA